MAWVPGVEEAEAYPGLRRVSVPRPSSGGRYLVALHEFGHVLDPLAKRHVASRDPYRQILVEAAAWAWASRNGDPSLYLARDWQLPGSCFASHLCDKARDS